MSYLFINRYCQVTAHIPEKGTITLTGWITQADEQTLLFLDENDTCTLINREQLVGSIVVLLEQKTMPKKTAQNGLKELLCIDFK